MDHVYLTKQEQQTLLRDRIHQYETEYAKQEADLAVGQAVLDDGATTDEQKKNAKAQIDGLSASMAALEAAHAVTVAAHRKLVLEVYGG